MANGWYEHGLREFASGNIDWINDDIRCALIDAADYTVDLVNHQDMADVAGAAQVALLAASLANKTVTGPGDDRGAQREGPDQLEHARRMGWRDPRPRRWLHLCSRRAPDGKHEPTDPRDRAAGSPARRRARPAAMAHPLRVSCTRISTTDHNKEP